jgi:hypothetical protein
MIRRFCVPEDGEAGRLGRLVVSLSNHGQWLTPAKNQREPQSYHSGQTSNERLELIFNSAFPLRYLPKLSG